MIIDSSVSEHDMQDNIQMMNGVFENLTVELNELAVQFKDEIVEKKAAELKTEIIELVDQAVNGIRKDLKNIY